MSDRFEYVKYDNTAIEESAKARDLVEKVEAFIMKTFQPGRSQSLALTALEETYSWIGKAIRDKQMAERKAR